MDERNFLAGIGWRGINFLCLGVRVRVLRRDVHLEEFWQYEPFRCVRCVCCAGSGVTYNSEGRDVMDSKTEKAKALGLLP